MMKLLLIIVLVVYALSALYIFLYTFFQVHLLWAYLYKKKKIVVPPIKQVFEAEANYPMVTVQLPLYNEPYVAERLIDAICQIQYPISRLEVQILDDSTDETVGIVNQMVSKWQQLGWDIKAIRRANRKGYKAGALKHGLAIAKGEFIAIFDADFLPSVDFLEKTVPMLSAPNIGMVQTRWGHINRDYSLLTQSQSFWLENHFRIEQTARHALGLFFNFNGTAGIWRKQAILDAGNWQEDTLTEDLDLSYRCQLKGWQFTYLEDVVSPAELPPTLEAFRGQQFRWIKGGAEVSIKLTKAILRSKFSFIKKIHAIAHLLNSGVYLALAVAAISSLPLMFIKSAIPTVAPIMALGMILFLNFAVLTTTYYVANKDYYKQKNQGFWSFIKMMQVYLSVSMGMAFHNAKAVFEGLTGKKSAFIRTPKFNVEKKGMASLQRFRTNKWVGSIFLHSILFTIFLAACVYGVMVKNFGFLFFHASLCFGLGLLLLFEAMDFIKNNAVSKAIV